MESCFVICPIGEKDSKTRELSDVLYDHVIVPFCDKMRIEPTRIDKINKTGVITEAIIKNILSADLVVADLRDLNPNVFYELGFRHATGKPVVLIKPMSEKRPFDISGINTIDYEDLTDIKEAKRLGDRIYNIASRIKKDADDADIPYINIINSMDIKRKEIKHELMNVNNKIEDIGLFIEKYLGGDEVGRTRIDAEYIDGEDRAFAALTQATARSKREVRSTRFFPDSVLGNQNYVNAIEARVLGNDGMKPLSQYYRIIALNNKEKLRDVIHHITMFKGKPFYMCLSSVPNAFELVVIDDSDVFIHFYKERMVIASTLHIKERNIVWEFREIYDKMVKNIKSNYHFDCLKINDDNYVEEINRVESIFAKEFGVARAELTSKDQN